MFTLKSVLNFNIIAKLVTLQCAILTEEALDKNVGYNIGAIFITVA